MIVSGRVVKKLQNANGEYYLVKPIQVLSQKTDMKFGQEFYVVWGKVIQYDEHIAFPFSPARTNERNHHADWIVPSYFLTYTYSKKMMGSKLLSAIPDRFKKSFAEGKDRNAFRAYGDMEPQEIMKEMGVKYSQATRMINQIRRANALSMEFSLLHSLDIYSASVDKLAEIMAGSNGIQKALTDPYSLMGSSGMTFLLCDLIGKAIKVDPLDESRVKAAIINAVELLVSDGNSAFNEERVIKTTLKSLGLDQRHALMISTKVRATVKTLAEVGLANVMSTYELYEGDAQIGHLIRRMCNNTALIKKVEFDESIIPENRNEEQRQAIRQVTEHGFSIITGGPGTGKTTVIKDCVAQFEGANLQIAMCAPTGKAAVRISESSGMNAETLHALLGFNPGSGFKYNKRNPMPYDFVVIDEFSMVDADMFRNVLEAIKPSARLVLCGDDEQLASVGIGNVLSDLLNSKLVPATELTKPNRTAMSSYITRAAYAIRQGIMPDMERAKKGDTEFIFIPSRDSNEAREIIVDLMANRIPAEYGCSHDDIQILTPMKIKAAGVDAFNEVLHDIINPVDYAKPVLRSMGQEYRVEDRVMQTQNNKDLGISNGDVGKISSIDFKFKKLHVDFGERRAEIPFDKVYQLRPAYAMTIHKSQGSECPHVIMPMTMEHRNMLTRRLVYTGITRAKQVLWMVGDREAFEYAVKNTQERPRETALSYLIGKNSPGNYYHRPAVSQSKIVRPDGVPF